MLKDAVNVLETVLAIYVCAHAELRSEQTAVWGGLASLLR